MSEFDFIWCVVNRNMASKALKIAKKGGVKGGTIFLGRGTVKNKLLELLELAETSKAILIMISERHKTQGTIQSVYDELSMQKPNHGIIFSYPLNNYIGTDHSDYYSENDTKVVENSMYSAIYTVVEKGYAEQVTEAANQAGAQGGTIINARGSGTEDISILFNMAIETEKELVMILAKNELVKPIVNAIRDSLHIDQPGNGVIFVSGIDQVYGLFEKGSTPPAK